MAAVVLSSALLVLDNPRLEPGSTLARCVYTANVLFTLLFTLEAALKATAYGFCWTRHAYLKDGWNALDFGLLCISIGSLLAELLPQLAVLKGLRALRALRPLRLLSRNEGMRIVIETLGEALPAAAAELPDFELPVTSTVIISPILALSGATEMDSSTTTKLCASSVFEPPRERVTTRGPSSAAAPTVMTASTV